jgi:PPOX class probable F420-dependent enzyme
VPASHRGLLDAPVGVLGTVGSDGLPQLSAVWFLYDESDGVLRISLNTIRQKYRNLRKRSQASFLILDPATPYRTIELRGRVEIARDDDYAFAERLGQKYGGADLRQMDAPGQRRVVIALRPEKINTWGD